MSSITFVLSANVHMRAPLNGIPRSFATSAQALSRSTVWLMSLSCLDAPPPRGRIKPSEVATAAEASDRLCVRQVAGLDFPTIPRRGGVVKRVLQDFRHAAA